MLRFTVRSPCRYYSIDLVQQHILSTTKSNLPLSEKLYTDRRPKYNAVIFDKDGTLICFHSMWTPWVTKLVSNINMELSMDLSASIYSILGVCNKTYKAQTGLMAEGTKDQIKQALERVIMSETGKSAADAKSVINKYFENNASNPDTLKEIHNIRKLFKVIRQYGIKIGICTADTREGTIASLQSLNAHFLVDHLCCGDDPNCRPKPEPHNSLLLSEKLHVPVSEMVMVGDTKTDMEFGKNSKMASTIGVLSGVGDAHHLKESGAESVIGSVQDILPYLIPESPINLTKDSKKINSKNWKLIIIDKDGTLTDLHNKYKNWALLLGERLQKFTNLDMKNKFFDIIGFQSNHTFVQDSMLLEKAGLLVHGIIRYLLILEGYTNDETNYILKKVWVDTSIFGEEEIHDFRASLEELKSRGIKLALNSGDFKTSVENFIKRNNLDDVFDMVISADDIAPNFKPLPHSILKICKELKISPSDTLVVADAQTDMLCAKSAKVGASVGVLSGVGRPANLIGLCHVLIPNITFLPKLLHNNQHTTTEVSSNKTIESKKDNQQHISPVNQSKQVYKKSIHEVTSRSYSTIARQSCDYVIVGAGSAGCVLANRLSEDGKNRVKVLEAGPSDSTWTIDMPAALMYNLYHDKYNWYYTTVAQKFMNNREMYWPRGRVLGGSSSLNAMAYVRGHALDYDRWEKEGAEGWNYQSCLEYFKKSQTHEYGADDYRGGNGPLHVSRGKTNHPLHKAWIDAGIEAGYGFTDDMNGFRQEGVGYMDMTIHKGRRWSASRAYLRPAMSRSNLSVDTKVLVTRILFEGKKAVGVEMIDKNKNTIHVMADKEVILSGGSINSPQLLMLSGIGDEKQLKEHGIDVIQHVPGVGQNLQDHLEVYLQYKCKKPITLYIAQWKFPHHMIRIGLEWFLMKTGWGATSHLESGGFIRSEASVPHPDIQYHFLPSTVNDHGRQMGTCHAFQAHVGPMRSESRGTLKLKSNNPMDHPILDPNYCSVERDFWEFRQCVHLTREIMAQSSFDEFRGDELFPGKHVQSDKDIDEFIKNRADSAYHPSCTCRMGDPKSNDTVVDGSCRVVGVDQLRIVDASIMPSVVSGNLNGPTIMLAERAADIIRGQLKTPSRNIPVWQPSRPDLQREN